MKKIFVMALMGVIAAGCSNECVDLVENGQELNGLGQDGQTETAVAPVRVHVSGFKVDQADFTRSAEKDLASYDAVNVVTLAFYDGSTEVKKITQVRSDASTYITFGDFSLFLPMGSYRMVVVACYVSESSPFALTSLSEASYTGAHVFETFLASDDVAIMSTDELDISATLERIVSKLMVFSSDGKTADVKKVRMTFSGGSKSFNPTTGLATSNTGFANTVGNSSETGSTSSSVGYLFLASDEQTMDVTIETLDAQESVIYRTTVADVPFQRNRVTKLTGALYTNAPLSGGFKVETDWLEDYEMGF